MKSKTININLTPIAIIMTVVFVVLKLCGVIAWSWWLVLLPVIVVGVLLILACLSIVLIALCFNRSEEEKRLDNIKKRIDDLQDMIDRIHKVNP
jgi:membrane protein implicated in regulation of membrane protease activity